MLPRYKCKRCGHVWIPRVEKPGSCPKCHNIGWDSDSTRHKYEFNRLAIGEEILYPWVIGKYGLPDSRENGKMVNALAQYSHSSNRKFKKHSEIKGLRIKRVY